MRSTLLISLLLAGCSGGEPDAPPPENQLPTDLDAANDSLPSSSERRGTVEITDPGVEPRFRLGIDAPQTVAVSVAATRRNSGTVGTEAFDDAVGADYVLGIELVADELDGEYVARLEPTIVETMGFAVASMPGSWDWRLTSNGVLTEVASPPLAGSDAERRLSELLSPYALFLMVPGEPVGAGARWSYHDGDAADATTVLVESIGDDEVIATMSLTQGRPDMRFDAVATGSWLRRSLVARQVTARVELSVTGTTTRNGEEVDVQGSSVGELIYEADR